MASRSAGVSRLASSFTALPLLSWESACRSGCSPLPTTHTLHHQAHTLQVSVWGSPPPTTPTATPGPPHGDPGPSPVRPSGAAALPLLLVSSGPVGGRGGDAVAPRAEAGQAVVRAGCASLLLHATKVARGTDSGWEAWPLVQRGGATAAPR